MSCGRHLILSCVAVTALTGCSLFGQAAKPREDVSYEVVRGDTLSEIGERFGITASDLQRYNSIQDPRQLQVGQVLRIPAVGPIDTQEFRRNPFTKQQTEMNPEVPLRMISMTAAKGFVGNLAVPVEDARHTSNFGWRWRRFHEGADLAARRGTPILAAHDGTVVIVREHWGRYGKVVVIKGDGLVTLYGHNSRNHVEEGDAVSKGDHIADVGDTGDATGPHLHFETRIQDDKGHYAAINPLIFFPKE